MGWGANSSLGLSQPKFPGLFLSPPPPAGRWVGGGGGAAKPHTATPAKKELV